MSQTNYLAITIAQQPADVGSIEDFPVDISYTLEDSDDFQKKSGDEAFDVDLPATLQNQKIANTFHDPSYDDATPGQAYRSHQPCVIEANGEELLVGKAFLQYATHSLRPQKYTYSFYGGNSNWIIDLKEKTLYDFVSQISFTYDLVTVVNSWNYDGTDETLPFVFAPVRYRGLMDEANSSDDNVALTYLRPSLSKYWILYWMFKSLGYRIQSEFLDLEYFRRQVMPWTWGNFNSSEGTKLDIHKFYAKGSQERFINDDYNDWLEVYVTDTGLGEAVDNNDEFTYTDKAMVWEYKAPDFGVLNANFELATTSWGNIVGSNSFFDYKVHFFHYVAATGIESEFEPGQTILSVSGRNLPIAGQDAFGGEQVLNFVNRDVSIGDKITARLRLVVHEGWGLGARVNFHTKVDHYILDFFRINTGGTISFENLLGFKKHKALDFLAGIVDEFDMSIFTDTTNKVVYIEPTHGYNVDGTPRKGYFNDNQINWEDKKDLSKEAKMTLFSDYEKEVIFKYKDDPNDGVLKVVQDRNQNTLAAAKYVFPDRFKAGKKEHENRFFSPTMHYDAEQFKSVTGVAPQMVCIIPENISNTSNSEADNTFAPKSCYYKGLVTDAGGWKFNGFLFSTFPYMFAVNYKPGGENDPVLSYSDENINGVVAKGLMKQFFIQRLAIMRNGQYYEPHMMLKDVDVKRMHREFKVMDGQRWELVQINNYLPLKNESTTCFMRRWMPVIRQDHDNSYPSEESVLNTSTLVGNDVKYAALKALLTDIPK